MTYTIVITWKGGRGQTIREGLVWKEITEYLWDIYTSANNESVLRMEIMDESMVIAQVRT